MKTEQQTNLKVKLVFNNADSTTIDWTYSRTELEQLLAKLADYKILKGYKISKDGE